MTRLHKANIDKLDDDHVDLQRRVTLGEASAPRDVALDAIAEHDVLEYLAAHPEFLVVNPQVLETADIMHDAGNAASLIERQVDVLRQRNEQLRLRLHNLAVAARANELRVRHINRLATDLMQADSAPETVHVLVRALKRDFAVDASYIGIYDATVEGAANIGRDDPVRGELRNLIRTGIIECGPISENRAALLFGDEPIQSAAVMPLDRCDPIGLLAVGSRDPKRYQPEMGSMFLDLIAGLASTALRRCLAQAKAVDDAPADEAAVADARSA